MNLLLVTLVWFLIAQDPPVKVPDYPPPAEVKAAFLKLLDRPKVPADPQVVLIAPEDLPGGVTEESRSIAVERKPDGTVERVTMLIFHPRSDGKKHPAVILLHGTGGNRNSMRDLAQAMAVRGIVAVSIDGRYHGVRAGQHREPLKAYSDAIIRAWKSRDGEPREHPFYFDTCWDVWRTIDFIQTLPDVDPDRIGLTGISKGGIETWLAGAVDDRVKVAAPCIGVQSFRWSLESDNWQGRANTIAIPHRVAANDRGEAQVTKETCRALWNKVIPGMLDQFDCPSMLRLFAGRPLLIINGELDPNCPIGGARIAFASAEAAFKEAGKPDRLEIYVAMGKGHTVTESQKKALVEWFARWLK